MTLRARRRPFGRGVLLVLDDGAGTAGVGEASPLPGYSPDTIARAQADLDAWAAGAWPDDESVEAALARLARDLASPAARFAAETALLDLVGRHRRIPAHRLLGAPPEPRVIPLSWLLPAEDAAATEERVRTLGARGVRHVKLKIGADPEEDLARLAAVRRAAPGAGIRLDAGGRIPVVDVPAFLAACARYGVELVEEPCAPEALAALPRLAVPVALDESLQRADAEALLRETARAQPLAAVVLKPTALGGFARCLALARAGAAVGAAAVVTHTFDGPVAMAAAAELALAIPGVPIAGLAPHERLAGYPAWPAAALGDAAIAAHDVPGLGLEPPEPACAS